MRKAIEMVDGLLPSVVAIAKGSGITPEAFAKTLADREALSIFRNEVAVALQKRLVAEAAQEAHEAEDKPKK